MDDLKFNMEFKYWNYRVLVFPNMGDERYFQICEVHYNENDIPIAYTDSNLALSEDGIPGLERLIFKYRKAFDRPILCSGESFPQEYKPDDHEPDPDKCWCLKCQPNEYPNLRFNVCQKCGNKRCPHATDHQYECTNSNETGQVGSVYQ